MSDPSSTAASAGMSAAIRDALHAAAASGMTRGALRELCRQMPAFPRFEGAMTHLVRSGQVARRGKYTSTVYYASEALAEEGARLSALARAAQAAEASEAGRPQPAERRPGWETVHRTPAGLKQPPARGLPPVGQTIWPEGVKVTVCPSPPAHSRYYVPPETVGQFTLEWRLLRERGSAAKGVARG